MYGLGLALLTAWAFLAIGALVVALGHVAQGFAL